MIKLRDSQITQILPEKLAKEEAAQALSYALNQAVNRFVGYCKNISVFAIIDRLPDEILNLLAIELDTQYYDDSLAIDVKRELIKNTLIWYMGAGTPNAVEELVLSVFGRGEVKEWYEYGDEPFFFKIITDTLLTPGIDKQLFVMLEKVKNVRSHVRSIEIPRKIEQNVFWGMGIQQSYHPPAILDGYKAERHTEDMRYVGFAEGAKTYSQTILEAEIACDNAG